MIVGIVGSEAAKFTKIGEDRAIEIICSIIDDPNVTEVVSGKCHLGGIDIWAAEIGRSRGKIVTEFPPEYLSWQFYKERNLRIAGRSDIVHCITVDKLPDSFHGMKFEYCYHCNRKDHIKSGGCWTMKKAKKGKLHIVENI